jgi:hypothetical protein
LAAANRSPPPHPPASLTDLSNLSEHAADGSLKVGVGRRDRTGERLARRGGRAIKADRTESIGEAVGLGGEGRDHLTSPHLT